MKPLQKFALVALIAALPSLVAPPECAALSVVTERYYSDATYSVLVGQCVDNMCTGQYSCSGVTSDYMKVTTQRCWIGP